MKKTKAKPMGMKKPTVAVAKSTGRNFDNVRRSHSNVLKRK